VRVVRDRLAHELHVHLRGVRVRGRHDDLDAEQVRRLGEGRVRRDGSCAFTASPCNISSVSA
jgi:hypothetical protein